MKGIALIFSVVEIIFYATVICYMIKHWKE